MTRFVLEGISIWINRFNKGTFTVAHLVRTRVRLTSEFGSFEWCERCLPNSGAHRTRVRLKRWSGVRFKWTPVRFASDVKAIVPIRGSEPLLLMYYFINVCVCVHFTHFPDEHDWSAASSELEVSFMFTFSVL